MKIFIVDDDQSYSSLLSRELEKFGHKLKTFESGFSALDPITKEKPEVVISDWYLRGEMLGSELAREIIHRLSQTKIIFVSGAISELLKSELAKLGPYPLIKKSLSILENVKEIELELDRIGPLCSSQMHCGSEN